MNRLPIVHLLHRASQAAEDAFANAIGDGITARQAAVLAAVAERDGCSQVDVTAATGIDRSTLADMMRRLVERGLLSRKRGKLDARAYVLSITASGRAALRKAEKALGEAEAAVLADMPAKRRDELLAALALLVDADAKRRAVRDEPARA